MRYALVCTEKAPRGGADGAECGVSGAAIVADLGPTRKAIHEARPRRKRAVNHIDGLLPQQRSAEGSMATSPRPTAAFLARYPVPIELISALYRADDGERDRLLSALPEHGRARVAAYCAETERLQPLCLQVASTCAEASLIRAAGPAIGASLFARSRIDTTTAH